nr:hypothetical protein [uncultured Pseudodesulfovibrio sp.]
MKFANISRWNYTKALEGVLFFAQRLNESLFDYSFDKYKIPAMHTQTLCIEAIKTIEAIEAKIISPKNITHILEELDQSIRDDTIAKKMIGIDYKLYLTDTNEHNLKDKKNGIELMLMKLGKTQYIKETQQQLYEAIKNCEKKKIDRLTIQFALCLRTSGYNNNYIYKKANNFFFYRRAEKISTPSDLLNFFKIFDLKHKSYHVVFKVKKLAPEYKELLTIFGLNAHNNIQQFSDKPQEISYISDIKPDELFIKANGIKSLDPYSAKVITESLIRNFSNIVAIYRHKRKISWSKDAIVCEEKTKNSFIIKTGPSPIEKCIDSKPIKAYKEITKFSKGFRLHPVDIEKFIRVVKLHGSTISTNSLDNQLLNLWTALETLTPPTKTNKSNIKNVIDTLVPFQTINYTRYIIENLANSLFRWRANTINSIINKIDCDNEQNRTNKIAALLSIKEYEPIRKELYTELDKFTLMRYRFFTLSEQLTSSDRILEFTNLHEKRVRLQLRRIYRTRNLIVHSGDTPQYLDVLVENAHTYLDIFLRQVLHLVIEKQQAYSMEHAVKEVQLLDIAYKKRLSEKKQACEKSNYLNLVFGVLQ